MLYNLIDGNHHFLAWINIDGKRFFPKMFFNEENHTCNLSSPYVSKVEVKLRGLDALPHPMVNLIVEMMDVLELYISIPDLNDHCPLDLNELVEIEDGVVDDIEDDHELVIKRRE